MRVRVSPRGSAVGLATGWLAGAVGGDAGGWLAGWLGCCPRRYSSISCFVTRPPGPAPLTAPRSTPWSAAIRLATGVARSSLSSSPGALAGAGAAGTALGASLRGFAAFSAAAPLPSSIVPSTSPIWTSSPAWRAILPSTPSLSAGTSRSTLSVSSSTTASPALTGSPSCFNQRATVASTTDSPSAGTTILVAMRISYPEFREYVVRIPRKYSPRFPDAHRCCGGMGSASGDAEYTGINPNLQPTAVGFVHVAVNLFATRQVKGAIHDLRLVELVPGG